MTMLYRSTDRLCRCGAPMKNLAHSASFESLDKNAPSKTETKHLGWRCVRMRAYTTGRHSLFGVQAMTKDVLGALWFIMLLISIYGMVTGDLCLWRRDD